LLLSLSVVALLSAPAFDLEVITVRGLEVLDRDTVLQAAGLRTGVNLFRVDLGAALRGLHGLPRVASASVRRVWPNGVDVTVKERTGLVLIPCGGGWVEVSGDGKALEIHPSSGGPRLPVLEGIEPTTIGVGETVPSTAAQRALMGIAVIRESGEEISSALIGGAGLEVVVPADTRLYLGAPDAGLVPRVHTAVSILKDLRSRGLGVVYIDVRLPGQPVIKPR
jgi:cell division protein FtsQ